MTDRLRLWLNGSRPYIEGLMLLEASGAKGSLITALRKGDGDYNKKILLQHLLGLYNSGKGQDNGTNAMDVTDVPKAGPPKIIPQDVPLFTGTELYSVCKREADNLYKKAMNLRAVLFEKSNNPSIDINHPSFVKERREMALEVLELSYRYSELYDRADYVAKYGRLPGAPSGDESIDGINDANVFRELDNRRKLLSKTRKKELTPERQALIEKLEKEIQILGERWQSLK